MGAVSGFVCGSGVDSKVGDFGDCGDTIPCVFREMSGSPSDPVRSRVGEPMGVGGEYGDSVNSSVASSVLTFICACVGSSDVSIGAGFG